MKNAATFSRHLAAGLVLGLTHLLLPATGQSLRLEKKWETAAVFREPESVLYDKDNGVLYTSNINNLAGGKDGNGSIGKLSVGGKVQSVDWVIGGLDSPKGLGLHRGLLYVADLTRVVVIDVKAGVIVRSIEVPDAGMLNDITVDEDGLIYISDSTKKRIYLLRKFVPEVWLEDAAFQKPNGLLALKNKFYMVDMTTGVFYEIDKNSKSLRQIATGLVGGDGIVAYGKDFIISNWNGEIWFVSAQGQVEKLLDTKTEKVNAADMEYLPQKKLLLVPTFYANRIVAYSVKK